MFLFYSCALTCPGTSFSQHIESGPLCLLIGYFDVFPTLNLLFRVLKLFFSEVSLCHTPPPMTSELKPENVCSKKEVQPNLETNWHHDSVCNTYFPTFMSTSRNKYIRDDSHASMSISHILPLDNIIEECSVYIYIDTTHRSQRGSQTGFIT